MRASPFAILAVLLVVVGLAALFEHRPGPGPAETAESPTQQPTVILAASNSPPQSPTTQADAPPQAGPAMPTTPPAAPSSEQGRHEVSVEKLLAERPEHFAFNGSVGALTLLHRLHANIGETVRLFFDVSGPNFTSSFHVIGEIFDKVYTYGGVLSPPLRGLQTVSVPAGGAVIAELKPEVPGNYTILDHAIARAERGLAATLVGGGYSNPEVYTPLNGPKSTGGH